MGVDETKQVATVIEFLTNKNYEVVLWGRSLGAVTALKYASFKKIKLIVADSPFRSLKEVGNDLIHQYTTEVSNYIPKCLINCIYPCMYTKFKHNIKEEGKYNLD